MNDNTFLIIFISAIVYFIIMIMLYRFIYSISQRKAYESYVDTNIDTNVDNNIINTVNTSDNIIPSDNIPFQNNVALDNIPLENNIRLDNNIPLQNNVITDNSKCTTGCDLLPVHEPLFNLKEIVKQMVLLEDHLFHEQKRCRECITKHFITIIGLAEEGLTLDTNKMYEADFQKILKETTELQDFLHKTNDFDSIALKLRNLRKSFMNKVEPWIS